MLSLVVIACNEADRLGRCLDSVPWASEKLVVDSGSRDETVAVARRHGARVVQTDWPGFVEQKNRAWQMTSQPWVLSLDADEWLEPETAVAVERLVGNPGVACAFSFPRCTRWAGRPLRHGRSYPDRQVRLARREHATWVGEGVHERLRVDGRVVELSEEIGHDPYRTVAEHLDTIRRYTDLAAASFSVNGIRPRRRDVILRPPLRFVDAYLLRAGFLDGGPGLAVAGLSALYTGMKWGKAWQLMRSESPLS